MTDNKVKILIVEDDLSSQQYYSFVFKNQYEIKMVSTTTEAKRLLRQETFDIALIDLSLSAGENGLDLIKYLKKNHPQKPAAIALTAHAFPQNQEEARKAGAVEFLTKPILSKELLNVVERHTPVSEE